MLERTRMQILNILGPLLSIIDRISQYFYEQKLKKEGRNEAEREALLEARKAEKAADRAVNNPSILDKLRKRRDSK